MLDTATLPPIEEKAERPPLSTVDWGILIIAFIMVIAALKLAREILVPITLSIALSYSLMPLVMGLHKRLGLPLNLSAAGVLAVVLVAVVASFNALQPQALKLLDSLPQAAAHVEKLLHQNAIDEDSAFNKAHDVAAALEKVASGGNAPSKVPDDPIALRDYLWSGTTATLRALGNFIIIIALVYFLLISSHSFKRKIVKISGDTLKQKKLTVQILDEIDSQVQRYLIIQLGTSAAVGVLTGCAFGAVGLANAAIWGVCAGVLHLIPYVGPAVVVVLSGIFAYLQFEDMRPVLLVAGSALGISGAIGLMLVPWLTEKVGRINAVATFVSLILWDWLWGVPGLLLGIPIMMTVMAVCERVDHLVPIAELLGQNEARVRRPPPPSAGNPPLTES